MKAPSLPDPADLLQAALKYHAQGWNVIPVTVDTAKGNYKRAAVKWTRYQTHRPTEAEVREMFRKRNLTGLAVLLGEASGNLYARDFDDPAAYANWSAARPDFATRLPTVATRRGCHTYFRTNDYLVTVDYGDGELRGNGGYSILPPSVHHTGTRYRWTVLPPPGQIPVLDLKALQLDRPWICTESQKSQKCTEEAEAIEVPEVTDATEDNRSRVESCGVKLDDIIQPAIVTSVHTSNILLFKLAGCVKSAEEHLRRKLSEDEVLQVFYAWYEKSLPYLREETSRDEYELEFMRALDTRKFGSGERVLYLTLEKAKHSATAKAALRWTNPNIRLMVTWTRELQRYTHPEPFFLSSHQAAHYLGQASHTTAYTWLSAMASPRVGILQTVKKGDARKATRYRYLPPLDE